MQNSFFAHFSNQNGPLFKDEPVTCSTIDVFLERHPEAIEDFLNECISTNGQELDSDELQIIFNFELFFKEGFPKDESTSGTIYEVLNNVDELAFHKKVIEENASQLLEHPGSDVFGQKKSGSGSSFQVQGSTFQGRPPLGLLGFRGFLM